MWNLVKNSQGSSVVKTSNIQNQTITIAQFSKTLAQSKISLFFVALLSANALLTNEAQASGWGEDQNAWQFQSTDQQAVNLSTALTMKQAENGYIDALSDSVNNAGNSGGLASSGSDGGGSGGGSSSVIGNYNAYSYNITVNGSGNTVSNNSATNTSSQSNQNSNQTDNSKSAQVTTLNGQLNLN